MQIRFCLIYVSTYCVERVKKLDNDQYFLLVRWHRGNVYSLNARSTGFKSRLCVFIFYLFFVVPVVLLFSPNTLFAMNFYNFLCNVNSFSLRNILLHLWLIIWVSRYRASILNAEYTPFNKKKHNNFIDLNHLCKIKL